MVHSDPRKDLCMKNNQSNQERERMKVYVRSLGKVATVRRIEDDPVHGKQYLVSTYSPIWGPDYQWVKENDVEVVKSMRQTNKPT